MKSFCWHIHKVFPLKQTVFVRQAAVASCDPVSLNRSGAEVVSSETSALVGVLM